MELASYPDKININQKKCAFVKTLRTNMDYGQMIIEIASV